MKASFALTGEGIARALGRIAELPAVDQAVRERAEAVAERLSDVGATRVLRRDAGDYVVTVSGEGLAAREFGSVGREGDSALRQVLGREPVDRTEAP